MFRKFYTFSKFGVVSISNVWCIFSRMLGVLMNVLVSRAILVEFATFSVSANFVIFTT